MSAGLSPNNLSPLAQDTWIANAVFTSPQNVVRMLRGGWRMSVDTRHMLESHAALRGDPWETAVRDVRDHMGALPAGFSLTALSSRVNSCHLVASLLHASTSLRAVSAPMPIAASA